MEKHNHKIQILIPLFTVSISLAALIYTYLLIPDNTKKEETYQQYEYHIAFVSEEPGSSYSKELYQGALEAGKKYNAYVEQIGEDLNRSLSLEDSMNMAIYENVDGILLRPNESDALEELVEKANSYGIPVITVQKDIPDSKRQGFVGSNDYFLGQEYGKRVMEIADSKTKEILVLFPEAQFDNTGRSWFSQGLRNAVSIKDMQYDFRIIQDDGGLNNAEELMRGILSKEGNGPDLILCLDETTTRSVSQLIEDSGRNRTRIIGSYVSDDILQSIVNGYIDSTIISDLKEMGRQSVDALMNYKKYHMVSYYTEIETDLLDREQAILEIKRREENHEN